MVCFCGFSFVGYQAFGGLPCKACVCKAVFVRAPERLASSSKGFRWGPMKEAVCDLARPRVNARSGGPRQCPSELQNPVPTRSDTMLHKYDAAETVATLGMPESSEMGTRDEGQNWGPQGEPSKSPTFIWGSARDGQANLHSDLAAPQKNKISKSKMSRSISM